MTLKIVRSRQLLRIRVSGPLAAHGSHLVRADWSNWCGKRSGLTLSVEYMGRTASSELGYVPVCINKAAPSRLVAIR
jgi:hypothetical protein